MENSIISKKDQLSQFIQQYENLIIAFSGGVDSSFLLAFAKSILHDKVIAVTAVSSIHPKREYEKALEFAEYIGVQHILFDSKELKMDSFLENSLDRCYFCKKHMLEEILRISRFFSVEKIAHGITADDLKDYRPGIRASKELGILSPMADLGFTKPDIRELSKEMNIPTWDKPSMSCLATRIPYGTRIEIDSLSKIEKSEIFLIELGFYVCRVRHYGEMARIEIDPAYFDRMIKDPIRTAILRQFKKIGYSHIALDLNGYVQGSMNVSDSAPRVTETALMPLDSQ